MARALTMHRVTVPSKGRDKYLASVKEREAHYTKQKCRFWVFEEVELRGVFIEFMEADDIKTLAAAHKQAPGQVLGQLPIYHQLEIA